MITLITSATEAFPAVEKADADGLLAISQDFSVTRILQAYEQGIFPWFMDEAKFVYWFCVQPRCVLLPQNLIISKSMRQIINRNVFTFKFNTNFKAVITHCANTKRGPDNETWISPEFISKYTQIFEMGKAFCGEAYLNNELVGGLYGVRLGNMFFGESMFSLVANASKFAFIKSVEVLVQQGVQFIDCQQETPHLLSLGAKCIGLKDFKKLLKSNL